MKLFGIVILVLLLATGVFFFYLGHKSSKMDTPELISGKLASCGPKPNCVSSQSDPASEYYVAPLEVGGDDVVASLVAAIEQTGGVIKMQTAGVLQATYTSGIFRYVDDLQLSWEMGSTTVDVRSASRVGHSDMGANRKRVQLLRAAVGTAE